MAAFTESIIESSCLDSVSDFVVHRKLQFDSKLGSLSLSLVVANRA